MTHWLQKFEGRSRTFLLFGTFGFLLLVGFVDYWTGVEFSFSVFYLLGIGLGTWFISRNFGFLLSILSVLLWVVGDWAAGVRYTTPFIPIWNSTILLTFYGIVVWLLATLRSIQHGLEDRVKQRTQALTLEMAERERLEKAILEVGEQEQRRIGRDLHDSLCQHLTGTALAGQVLREKLATKSPAEEADARRVVELVEEGIAMARGLSRGIYPVEMEAEGLMTAFHELAVNLTQWAKVPCVFQHDSPVLIEDSATATHLYRIGREAVSNAIRHGKAKHIVITLTEQDRQVTLTIEDDGVGLPEGWQKGLGTRIMAHRASMIGGGFMIDLNPTGGTLVKCWLPTPPAVAHTA